MSQTNLRIFSSNIVLVFYTIQVKEKIVWVRKNLKNWNNFVLVVTESFNNNFGENLKNIVNSHKME